METTKKFFGKKAALGAFLVIFVNLGICTTLGVFLASIAAYIGWDLGTVAICGTLNCVVNIILSLFVPVLMKKLGFRKLMLISIIAVCGHILIYTLAQADSSVMSLAFIYIGAMVASIAIQFGTHAVCSGFIAEWYADTHSREKVTSTVVSGAAFGAAGWVFLAGRLLDSLPDYKSCYYVLAIIGIIIGLVAVIGFVKTPAQLGQEPAGLEIAKQEAEEASANADSLPGVTKVQALKSVSFWMLVIGFVLAITAASGFISYNASYWQAMGMTPGESATWNAIWLLLSAVILIFAGKMFKMIGNKGFTIYVCVTFALSCFMMIDWGNSLNVGLLVLVIILAALGYPLCAAFPTLVAHSIFGPREIGAIIGTSMTAVYAGQAIGPVTFSAFLGAGWNVVWTLWAVMALAGMIFILIACLKAPYKMKK